MIILFLALTYCSEQFISDDVKKDYVGQNFKGEWLKSSQKKFSFLKEDNGSLEIQFKYQSDSNSFFEKPYVNEVILIFLDPKYSDRQKIGVVIPLNQFKQGVWQEDNIQISIYQLFKDKIIKQTKNVLANYTITLKNNNKSNDYQPETTSIQVHIQSTQYGVFSMDGTAQHKSVNVQATFYALFLSIILGFQILCASFLTQSAEQQVQINKLSLGTISLCNIQDFFLTMNHFYFLLSQQEYYIYLLLPLFLSAVLSLLFDMKLLMFVWRSKYARQLQNQNQFRTKLTMFYFKFYFVLITYVVLMYVFPYQIWSMLIPSLIFLPQIIHNVRIGNNPNFYPIYVFGYLGSRMILPLYYHGCSQNIYLYQPNYTFCQIWVGIFIIMIIFLYMQNKLGPRFFIPKRCIPGYYDYKVKYMYNPEDPIDCAICMQPLHLDYPMMNNSILEQNLIKQKIVYKTPCGHFYHPECLVSWINVKMECPNCRSKLPVLEV